MIRHALQAELYGLTTTQRNQGAAQVNAALDGENVDDVTNRTVIASRTVRGVTSLFVEADFSSDAAGQRIFNAARSWAATRATDTTMVGQAVHSYVRLKSVDDVARTITTRYAESPGWVTATDTVSLDSTRI